LAKKIKKYKIERQNTYNMDEKGFLLDMLTKAKQVFTKAAFESGKIKNTIQDGNRKWITILATICADRTALSPGLIYQAVTGNIQDSWLQDFDPNQHPCFFASSPTG